MKAKFMGVRIRLPALARAGLALVLATVAAMGALGASGTSDDLAELLP